MSIVESDLAEMAESPYLGVTQMGHQPEACKRYPKRAAAVALPGPDARPF
jgi:hypothetical protein